MTRNETMAFGGSVAMLTEKAKGIVQMFDEYTVVFKDDATAESKNLKVELESAGFHFWSLEP